MTTTLSISQRAKSAGKALAKADRRSLSGQIEVLILEEAARRGLLKTNTKLSPLKEVAPV